MEYNDFLFSKSHLSGNDGFQPDYIPEFLYDFQKHLFEWSLNKGRAGIFADCGLGKTPIQLCWADAIVKRENKPVLILTPLAVSQQTVKEGKKFGIDCKRSPDGKINSKIVITNYERIQYFNKNDFAGVVCDESSILKNYNGARRGEITDFMKKIPYRLLCTATAAPNDYTELGTSSEALSEMGYMDMLGRFYKNTQSNCALRSHYRKNGEQAPQWMFKKHAENHFWRWVSSWAKAIRKPSDIGFNDDGFILPELIEIETVVPCSRPLAGKLFVEPAMSLQEQREERRATLKERCECAAEKVSMHDTSLVWCHLNDEGDLLEQIIPNAIQIAGKHSDEYKESVVEWFLGEKCICNDTMFRDKVTTWEKERLDTGKNIIENIVKNALKNQRNMEPCTEKSAKNITRNITLQIKNKLESSQKNTGTEPKNSAMQTEGINTRLIKNIENIVLNTLDELEKNIQKQEQTQESKNTDREKPTNSYTENNMENVQSAAHPKQKVEGTDSTLTTATPQRKSEGCCAPLVILDSESLTMIQKFLEKQHCICGYLSGTRRLISKPKMFGFGLNFQFCSHMTFFPSHSYEQYYQGVRRCWRFGQENPVTVDIITTEGELKVLKNLQRKAEQADEMFTKLTKYMNDAMTVKIDRNFNQKCEVPAWM